ncbi:Crp/Fnr family transcriptional regulator [Vibrio sp. 99-8-1]|uniref:Crp/Fnr family transcriptional regulator n=1 Tax=Vibrio sp. 99-8-1 TaxID=2607602 RepID=UPI001493C2E6|nr:Crp/Fnr family transcriptional regulator [Vibrio sp. 99-8-1]
MINSIIEEGKASFINIIKSYDLAKIDFKKGEFLYKQGQPVCSLYWVTKGEFSIKHTEINGKSINLGVIESNERFFGEIEFVSGQLAKFDLVANCDVSVKIITHEEMIEIINADYKVSLWLSNCIARSYDQITNSMFTMTLYPLIYNIALDLKQRYSGEKESVGYDVITQEAERFGCSDRVYHRVVKELVSRKLVQKSKQGLSIVNYRELCEFIDSFGS